MQEEIRILIIEDEEIWSDALQSNLHEFGFQVSEIVNSTAEALSAIAKTNYDLVLLDIFMDNQNSGIQIGKLLSSLYKKPFIFITSSLDSHTLAQAVEARPSGYLIKPVYPGSLFLSVQHALQNFQNNKPALNSVLNKEDFDFFFVKSGNKYIQIIWKDVVVLVAEGRNIQVFISSKKEPYIVRRSLQNLIDYSIPAALQNRFIQINRSEIVNINYISEISGKIIKTLIGTYQISDLFYKEAKSKLNIVL